MTKKVADQDSSPEKKPAVVTEEKSDKKDEKSSKTTTPKESSLNMPTIVTAALVIGFLVSIAASYGVQRYREVYIIPPQKEKAFPFSAVADPNSKRFRNVISESAKSSVLTFFEVGNPQKKPLRFNIVSDDQTLSLNNMEYFEFGTPDVYNGGKLSFYQNYLQATINYLIHPNSSVSISVSANGKRPDGQSNDLALEVYYGEEELATVSLKTGEYSFPGGTPYLTIEEFKIQTANLKNKWEETSKKLFSTGQQQIPKAYLELVESAYSFVANSLNVKKSADLIGIHQNITTPNAFCFLQPHEFTLNALDEQVFALIVLSKLESEDTLRVLNSWMNTVNELGHMGNRIVDGKIVLSEIQAPLLFQLIKDFLDNPLFQDKFQNILENLEYIAENTWKNSIGAKGLEEVRWLGSANGIFGPEAATPVGSSSFELLCLLGDISRVMQKMYLKVGNNNSKWATRLSEVEVAMTKYWDKDGKRYGDLVKGKIEQGPASHVPLFLGLPKEKSENLKHLLQNLKGDPNFLPFGLQTSEEQGVRVGSNYLLIQSLKHYSGLSGPSQEMSHQMYSVLKNHLAAVIARSSRIARSFYEKYDKNMQPIGPKGYPDGALVFAIMSSQ